MKQSNFLSLGWRDAVRSLLVALATALTYWLQDTFIPSLSLPEEVKVSISAMVGYLVKNFLTKPDTSRIVGDRPKDSGGR